MSVESAYNTYKAARRELVGSLLGGTTINYVDHRACVHGDRVGVRKELQYLEMVDLDRQNYMSGGQERNRLHMATRNRAWLSAITHRLNGTELYQEELWDNLHLRYGVMPQDIPAICNGYGKKLLFKYALSRPKCGLVLERNEDAAKE